jgi:hypothetical protein
MSMAGFDDVRPIVVVWAFATTALAWAAGFGLKRARGNLRRMPELAGEEGFAYALSFILTVPFMMLIVAVVVESTLLLIARIGVSFSAYAAARSAIVWETAEPAGTAETRVRMAAVHALAPFAPGDPSHLIGLDTKVDENTKFAYMGMYRRYCPDGPLSDGYLLRKLVYAHHALSLSCDPPSRWDSSVTAVVVYEHPFSWPIVGRAFGRRAPWGGPTFTYTLRGSATLQNEGPKNDEQTLGISYDSDR